MSAGRPILSTRWNLIPELISHKKTGYLVNPEDQDSLNKGINELLIDSNLRFHLSEEALEFIKTFSEQKVVKDTLIPLLKTKLIKER